MSNPKMPGISMEGDAKVLIVKPPNVVVDCGNAKIVFEKPQIQLEDMLNVYIQFKNYLNTFNGVNL
jgi:hypothetical protein